MDSGRCRSSVRWRVTTTRHGTQISPEQSTRACTKCGTSGGDLGEAHEAFFLLREPVSGRERSFVIELRHRHNLGCFRLSVSDDPAAAFERIAIAKVIANVTDTWLKLAAAYTVNGRNDEALHYLDKLLQRADGYEARKPIIDVAARFDNLLAALAGRRPDDLQFQLALARKLAERGKGRLAEKRAALAQADLQKYREILTRLRANYPEQSHLWEFGPDAPDAERRLAAVIGRPPAALTESIQLQPDQAAGYLARGDWYARRGLWRKAADDYAAAYRQSPETWAGMKLGVLLARNGEADRYREHCHQLIARFAGTTDNGEADRTLKPCCLLGPSLVGDLARLARLAEVAVAGDTAQPLYEWFLLSNGLYAYRAGRFEAAVTACRQARSQARTGDVDALASLTFAVEAMALHRSGDAEGARRSLAEATRLIDEKFLEFLGGDLGDGVWHDWLAAQVLHHEAQGLIARKKSE